MATKSTFFCKQHRAQAHAKPACKPQTGAGVNYVFIERGDAKLEVRWVDMLKAFEIRTIHAGLRDSLSVYPHSSNIVHVRVGEQL